MQLKNEYLQVKEFGEPESVVELQQQDIEVDQLGSDEMVIEMEYACIHPSDIYSIQGNYDNAKFNREHITPSRLGSEGIGKVIYAGKDAKYKKGEVILPMLEPGIMGVWSKYVVAKDGLDLPKDFNLKMGAQLLVNPFTILGMFTELEKNGPIKGKWLIISAANSTLGRMSIRYAKKQGVQVIGIVRKTDIVDSVKKEGCDKVLVQGKNDLVKEIMAITKNKGVEMALDAVGGELTQQLMNCMAIKGHLIQFGILAGTSATMDFTKLLFKMVEFQGFNLVVWLATEKSRLETTKKRVIEEMESKTFDSNVEAVYDIHDFKKAFHHQLHSETGRTGKLLFSF